MVISIGEWYEDTPADFKGTQLTLKLLLVSKQPLLERSGGDADAF